MVRGPAGVGVIGYGTALICSPTRREILRGVSIERDRQDAKWGGEPGTQRRDDHTYAAVIGEEFGEACQAWLERDTDALREELIQLAACAVAWVEELDNGGMRERPEPREGMVTVYDSQGEYVGCMGVETWQSLLISEAANSQARPE